MTQNHEIPDGLVQETNYTKAMFEATLRSLRRPGTGQTLTGAGTADLDQLVTFLYATTGGPYVVTLPAGTVTNQQKEFYFTGASPATFLVEGGLLQDFTQLEFAADARSAVLFWVGGAWVLVSGNCRPS